VKVAAFLSAIAARCGVGGWFFVSLRDLFSGGAAFGVVRVVVVSNFDNCFVAVFHVVWCSVPFFNYLAALCTFLIRLSFLFSLPLNGSVLRDSWFPIHLLLGHRLRGFLVIIQCCELQR